MSSSKNMIETRDNTQNCKCCEQCPDCKCCEQCPYCNKTNPDNLVTNVPPLTWEDTGICLPEESEILKGVIEDFQTAFQNKLNFYNRNGDFLLSTPQGQLVTSMAAIISDRNRLLAYYLNQVDPSYAVGRMQDGIGRIYFIERRLATRTKVVGLCQGAVGVNIPIGTSVQDAAGKIYEADANYTISSGGPVGNGGSVNVTFVCTEEGPIECPAESLSMYQLIQGWDSVENPEPGIVGRDIESQAQFEQRRRLSVAGNSVNSVDSIQAALLNLVDSEGVPVCIDAYVTENSSSDAIDGNAIYKSGDNDSENDSNELLELPIAPHSIYVCVAAGTANNDGTTEELDIKKQLIAKTIWSKKPPGCGMNGNIKVEIVDDTKDDNGQLLYEKPPEYTILYQEANKVLVHFYIHMAEARFKPKDAVKMVKDALVETFTGKDGSAQPRIGSQILTSSFYNHIQSLGSWSKIIDLKIGLKPVNDSKQGYNFIQIGINQIPTVSLDNIKVEFDE